jgi:hypothetical protein
VPFSWARGGTVKLIANPTRATIRRIFIVCSRCFTMVVVEKIRRRIKARERVHFPGLHRWSPGSGNERLCGGRYCLHLVLPKNSQEVSRNMRKRGF